MLRCAFARKQQLCAFLADTPSTAHSSALTLTWPSANRSSTSVRSVRDMPAWWQAMPYGSRSFSAAFFVVSASVCRISRLSDVSCARGG